MKESNEQRKFEFNNILSLLKSHKNRIIRWACCIVLCYFIFFVAFSFGRVVSDSMAPTQMTHDLVINNKLSYITKSVERGDAISFYSDEFDEILGKRVIGIAGDKIEFKDGCVYLNGDKLDESAYLGNDIKTYSSESFEVPEDCVFVLGDNRENSYDSRFFKNPYISVDNIIGKTIVVIPIHKLF